MSSRTRARCRLACAVLGVLALTACSSEPEAPAGERESTRTSPKAVPTPSTTDGAQACPNPHGGSCRGVLEAGTYRTTVFDLGLTYAVEEGWANMEDLPGQVLLLPPGRDIEGVDAGTADYLSVNHGVAIAAPDCSTRAAAGVSLRPADMVRALGDREGLRTTRPRAVRIAGLTGLTIDIRLEPGVDAGCRVAGFGRIIPLIIGAGPADLHHAQFSGFVTRLYVLRHRDSNVVVEVSDVADDDGPFDHESVIESLQLREQP
jgi:hypothetical protein